jgi:hypothetical protein
LAVFPTILFGSGKNIIQEYLKKNRVNKDQLINMCHVSVFFNINHNVRSYEPLRFQSALVSR